MSFLSTLQKKSADLQASRNGTPKAVTSVVPENETPELNIELAMTTSGNFIRVTFVKGRANDELQQRFLAAGFIAKEGGLFVANDTRKAREFLNAYSDAGLEIEDDEGDGDDDDDTVTVEPTPEAPEIVEPISYKRFKAQVSELMKHLNVDMADLALIAIDALHKQTFGRDA